MIRAARPEDAAQISAVLTASVVELCRADHGDDPVKLEAWLANKRPGAVAKMLADPAVDVLVAGEIEAVGAFCPPKDAGRPGLIALLYVDPSAQGRSHSSTLLASMEAALVERGVSAGRLTATATAREFYLRRGWQDDGPAREELGIMGYPMRKDLR